MASLGISTILIDCAGRDTQAGTTCGYLGTSTPLKSGDLSQFVNRRKSVHYDLKPAQLQALTDWLAKHTSAWTGMMTPPTNEPIEMIANLKHSDGSDAWLAVVDEANGERYLRLTASGGWVYQSLGGLLKKTKDIGATHPLSDQDLTELQALTRMQ